MKQLMFLFLISSCIIYSQNNYVADLVIESLYWQNDDEWASYLRADLYLDGTLLDPQSTYYYSWQRIENNVWKELLSSGFGIIHSKMNTDGHANQTWIYRVQITGHGFSVISESKLVGKYGTIHLLDCYAYKENGSSANDDVNINVWATYKWYQKSPGLNRTYFLSEDETNYLKDSVLSPQQFGQFFNMWDTDIGSKYYKNHEGIFVTEDMTKINVRHKRHNSGILNFYLTSEIPSLNISIIDPWFVDTENQVYYQAPYGYRNLGLSAIPEEVMNGVYGGVFLNQDPTFDPNIPNYSISIPSSIYLPQTGQTHNLYLQSWTADPSSGADFEDADSDTTGVVFKNDGVIITANVKATQLSDNQNAFINSSQRKFVKTPDGVMHLVYESMGKVWYETSTDNGTTWQLMNGGKPLDNGAAKLPSIDYMENFIVIVFQEKSGAQSDIMMSLFYKTGGYYQFDSKVVIDSDIGAYSIDADPVTAWDYNYNVLTVWKQSKDFDQLVYKYASIFPSSFTTLSQGIVTNSTVNSTNPTIYQNSNYPNQIYFHLSWEERTSSATSKIYYERLYPDENNNFQFDNFSDVSYKSGYSKNYSPSITGTYSNYIKLVWIGYRDNVAFGPGVQQGETKVLFKGRTSSSGWSSLYVFGNGNIQSVNINKSDDEKFAFAWSEGSGSPYQNKYVRSNEIPTTQRTLSTTGKDLQVNNGTTLNSMFANSFQSQTIPYSFSLSENLSGGLSKQTGLSIFKGREGVVVKDTAQFYFAVGDITLNGDNIDFVEIEDTVNINNRQMLNNYLITQPFTVNDNSTLTYGVQYGITDSASAVEALSDGTTINFSVELFDNQTGEVIGLFDNVTYSQNDVFQYNNIGYEVDMSGIGNRTVRFQLIVNTEADYEYSLSKRYADEEILGKSGKKQVKYQGSLAVTDYAIEQNYPNPFNPSTTIRYQLPQDGFVTLKIYDILGREVATLVNEEKTSGRYEVSFNASTLASGVYLYRLNVNNYVDVKKMLLLK